MKDRWFAAPTQFPICRKVKTQIGLVMRYPEVLRSSKYKVTRLN